MLLHVARWCAYVSGVVSIFGILFLIALYVALIVSGEGRGFGKLNDVSVIVHYTLLLPIIIALHRVVRPHAPALSMVSMLVGTIAVVVAVVLQILLVAGVLSFAEQIGMVVVAFLVVLGWFIVTGYLAGYTNALPRGMRLYVAAGLYFGYPFWAFSLARRLRVP